MNSNLLLSPGTDTPSDLKQQTNDLLRSILKTSPDAETKLRKFSESIADNRIDRSQQGKLRKIEMNAATLLAVERQLDPIHFPVFSIAGRTREASLPASETSQLQAKKKHLRIWARRRLND